MCSKWTQGVKSSFGLIDERMRASDKKITCNVQSLIGITGIGQIL